MRTLIWGSTFLRAFRRTVKRHPELRRDIEETLRLLAEDPFATVLATQVLTRQYFDLGLSIQYQRLGPMGLCRVTGYESITCA